VVVWGEDSIGDTLSPTDKQETRWRANMIAFLPSCDHIFGCMQVTVLIYFLGKGFQGAIPQPLPLLEPLVEPVPSLEGRVASGRASGIKFLPQHSSFEY
jgi:hypothetical protein